VVAVVAVVVSPWSIDRIQYLPYQNIGFLRLGAALEPPQSPQPPQNQGGGGIILWRHARHHTMEGRPMKLVWGLQPVRPSGFLGNLLVDLLGQLAGWARAI